MLLTEEEARTRWCPMARVLVGGSEYSDTDVAANRNQANFGITGSFCIASDCMMWRFETRFAMKPTNERKGYCSLGVKP